MNYLCRSMQPMPNCNLNFRARSLPLLFVTWLFVMIFHIHNRRKKGKKRSDSDDPHDPFVAFFKGLLATKTEWQCSSTLLGHPRPLDRKGSDPCLSLRKYNVLVEWQLVRSLGVKSINSPTFEAPTYVRSKHPTLYEVRSDVIFYPLSLLITYFK